MAVRAEVVRLIQAGVGDTEIDRDEIGQAVGVHRETVRRIRKEMPPLFLSTGITTRWTPRLLGCGQRTLPMNSGGDSR
jgi:hypothetical protein